MAIIIIELVITCVKIEQVTNILNQINSTHNKIQFTMEEEENSVLNYLDLSLSRKSDGKISFKIFRNLTHTEKYLDFESNHPLEHKNSVVRSLLFRAFNLCDIDLRQQEVNHVSEALQNNGYPKSLIRKCEQKLNSQFNNNNSQRRNDGSTRNSTQENESQSYVAIPYIPGVSERIRRVFNRYDVKVAHQPTRKLRNDLCRLKDRRPVEERAGVVYKLDCADCNAKYVGETGRQVRDRMTEHKRDISNKKPASKVYEHVSRTGHSFKFEEVSVLDSCSNRKTRLHLESIHTYKEEDSINRSLVLNSAYQPLFQTRN